LRVPWVEDDQHRRLPRILRTTRALFGEGGNSRNRLDAAGSLRDGTGRRGQHTAELQRQLDGRKPAGRQETGHDGWGGCELRTVQEGLRDQPRLAGTPFSLRKPEFSPVLTT